MRAGPLRYSISITAPSAARDAFGQSQSAGQPVLVLTARASIAALTGKEVFAAGAGFSGQLSHKVVIRNPGVTIRNGMTVNFGVRRLQVQFAQDPDERGRELDIFCLEQP